MLAADFLGLEINNSTNTINCQKSVYFCQIRLIFDEMQKTDLFFDVFIGN